MSKWMISFILFSVLLFSKCSRSGGPVIKGSWKWISIKCMSGDTVKWSRITDNEKDIGMKMWSDKYFTGVYRFREDTAFQYSYTGGTYRLQGNRYEETIMYHDQIKIPEMIGMKQMMLLEIKNDTLIQTYPVDEKGNIMNRNTFIEKYIRLD